MLFQKLGYSPTKYNLHVVPNCSLWAGILLPQMSSGSTNTVYEELGTLLFEHGRNYSLVLATSGEDGKTEQDSGDVVPGDVKCSTPEFDSRVHNLNESGYSTYNSGSSLTTPTTDSVIMMSSPKTSIESTSKGEDDCIVCDTTEDEMEDPLCIANSRSSTGRPCALPGLFSRTLHAQSTHSSNIISQAGPFFTPSHAGTKAASLDDSHSKTSNIRCNCFQLSPQPSNDDVIIISSSDEAGKSQSPNAFGRQSEVDRPSGTSSDEGIALESIWEEPGYGNREELPQCSCDVGQDKISLLLGGFQSTCQVNMEESAKHRAVIRCCGFELSAADLRTLDAHQWLNDQVGQIRSCLRSEIVRFSVSLSFTNFVHVNCRHTCVYIHVWFVHYIHVHVRELEMIHKQVIFTSVIGEKSCLHKMLKEQ